jgi:hypothetical protein
MKATGSIAAVLIGLFAVGAVADEVVVNRIALDRATVQQLEQGYGVSVPPGRYWYDPMSGVWGLEGGPGAGQIHPNLLLGGPLRQDASSGNTDVFVNGRELHRLDVQALQRCTTVIPGRYWVLANGIGGVEGGPAGFNLAALCGQRGGSSMRCEDYGNGQFNCSNPTRASASSARETAAVRFSCQVAAW